MMCTTHHGLRRLHGFFADKFSTCQSCSAPIELGDTQTMIQNATEKEIKCTRRIVIGVPAVMLLVAASKYSYCCSGRVPPVSWRCLLYFRIQK
jgi:hypothetical protein